MTSLIVKILQLWILVLTLNLRQLSQLNCIHLSGQFLSLFETPNQRYFLFDPISALKDKHSNSVKLTQMKKVTVLVIDSY